MMMVCWIWTGIVVLAALVMSLSIAVWLMGHQIQELENAVRNAIEYSRERETDLGLRIDRIKYQIEEIDSVLDHFENRIDRLEGWANRFPPVLEPLSRVSTDQD